MRNYFVYITTNPNKTVLYVGMTNNLLQRMTTHESNKGKKGTFAGEYHCYKLVWYERHTQPIHAINREKQIKGWIRKKKEALIEEFNPKWEFLNHRLY